MDGPIDRALIAHVATLASLSLTEDEAQKMTGEIASILGYIKELDTLDTSDVPPTAQIALGHQSALREDRVVEGLTNEAALAQAPRASQGGFAVPAFVEAGAIDHPARST